MIANENIYGVKQSQDVFFLFFFNYQKHDHEELIVDKSIFDVTSNLKSELEKYDPKEIYHSHNRMDYLKQTCRRIFLTRSPTNFNNRAGMKIAEVDFLIDFAITQASPVIHYLVYIKEDSIFYFADLCCGSGSFTEYLLWKRNGWRAKGFCISLKDDLEIAPTSIPSKLISTESVTMHFGMGDGDILKLENIESFVEFVMNETDHEGVHCAVADGVDKFDKLKAFSCAGMEENQELLMLKIIVCETIIALKILREGCVFRLIKIGGNFVVKMFDVFTKYSASLLFILCVMFTSSNLLLVEHPILKSIY
ncbi:hypothetical protein MXB_2865 [Myxobolus squamalis]|nr:hypothetical protein MXB_2865 [Myxobolus squamalis]